MVLFLPFDDAAHGHQSKAHQATKNHRACPQLRDQCQHDAQQDQGFLPGLQGTWRGLVFQAFNGQILINTLFAVGDEQGHQQTNDHA